VVAVVAIMTVVTVRRRCSGDSGHRYTDDRTVVTVGERPVMHDSSAV
jgi:hypothetical protein